MKAKIKTVKQYFRALKATPQSETFVNPEIISSEVGIPFYCGLESIPGLKAHFGHSWLCTDTVVGLRFYYLDGELVCASLQPGRKWPEEFEWVSVEAKQRVRDVVWREIKKQLDSEPVTLLDWKAKLDLPHE